MSQSTLEMDPGPILIVGALPEHFPGLSEDQNIYFLDQLSPLDASQANDRFFKADITKETDMRILFPENERKFGTIIFDIAVWHHVYREAGYLPEIIPRIGDIAMLLKDGGKLYLPQTITWRVGLGKMTINTDAMTKRDTKAMELFSAAGLTVSKDVKGEHFVTDLISRRFGGVDMFIVGTKVSSKGGRRKTRRRNKKRRKSVKKYRKNR